MNDHGHWLAKFARLRIDTASNAPHKPLLLLVVLDLAQEGLLGPVHDPLSLLCSRCQGLPGIGWRDRRCRAFCYSIVRRESLRPFCRNAGDGPNSGSGVKAQGVGDRVPVGFIDVSSILLAIQVLLSLLLGSCFSFVCFVYAWRPEGGTNRLGASEGPP